MLPEAFKKDVAGRLKFTHLDDVKTVCRLQAEVYKEKAKTCRSLRLVDLRADALDIALSALERYPVLESLEIVHCELRPKLPLMLKALEKIKLRQLHLQQNELFEEGTRQVIEALALQSNGTLAALSLGHVDVAGVKALAEAMKENRTLKQLSLSRATIAEEGAFALLEALQKSEVERRLDLTGCDLGNAHVALARALRTGQVQVKGTITHPAVEFLRRLEDEELEELEEKQRLVLDIHREEAFRKFFAPLCRALPELKLRELGLGLNHHGSADGARDLAAGLGQQTELERLTLKLRYNSLGHEGAKAVASALARLTELMELTLDLNKNEI
ncbi:Nlrc3, partial [Symbiodinium necroappetens]